jgi:adenosylcobyric acid synthase
MRGDLSLFADGMSTIAKRTGWPALGLVPFFADARVLPAEDTMDLASSRRADARVRIAVPVLPCIANFDDLDPLAAEPDVDLVMVPLGTPLPESDLVILPGSKATLTDLAALRSTGWDGDLITHRRRGGRILGLCGGYQMLGRSVSDPAGIEGRPGHAAGLSMLDVETVLGGDKRLVEVSGQSADGVAFTGYEMHLGRTQGEAAPMLRMEDGRAEGSVSSDGLVAGCYVHGLFAHDGQRRAWVARLGGAPASRVHEQEIERVLDGLAGHLEAHIDVSRLLRLAR